MLARNVGTNINTILSILTSANDSDFCENLLWGSFKTYLEVLVAASSIPSD